ncbi:MAG TPA: UvrD-helicase domain-containing protein [Burkholderiales bacterium]|nr:UvrD-helicase domain-containing protein [Burkholderiales bacterium]
MTETRAAADARARERALDVARSFIVQAPAGSGKTELLIQRYLALLARVDAPEEIVAITFTRKAASEMRNRVLAALASADSAAPPDKPHEQITRELAKAVAARDAKARWALAHNPGRLRIQTIDALCAWLTRHLPVLSGFGAQPAILEKADELHLEAAQRTLAGLDAREEWSDLVARVLRHLDNDVDKARELIATMLARRDQWLRHVADKTSPRLTCSTLETALADVTRDALASLTALMPQDARAELVSLAAYAAENLAVAGKTSSVTACRGMQAIPGAALEDLPAWRGLAGLLLTDSGGLRQRLTENEGFPAPTAAKGAEKQRREDAKKRFETIIATLSNHRTFIERLDETRILPPAAYTDAQWEVVDALAALLPVAVAQLEVLFKERSEVDFTQVSQAAVRALGEPDNPTDLALALDCRIRHILVDEFQDTSFSQFELLERLTAGWQTDDGRTLFVVGDPMQSIYRFREAEVGLYLRARREGIGGIALEPLTLALNFRSQQGIVDWVNKTFSAVLPDEEDLASGAVPFAASDAVHPAAGDAVTLHPLLAMEREAEAKLVTSLVQAARAENPDQTIAILVRSRAHLVKIAPRLKAAGLRFQAIEIEQLGHRPVVQDLLALTRALIHPADSIAWLAVLRAPWCGMTLADLDALAGHDHNKTIWDLMNDGVAQSRLSQDGSKRMARVREILGAALALRRREPLRRWIEGAWLALGGPACAEDETDIEDAQVFLKLLDELEEGGDLAALETLAERVAALYALPDTKADARLQVMTMHKAKGLEFDTVIVPGLGYAPPRKEPRLLIWLERPRTQSASDLLLAPIKEASEQTDEIYRYLDRLDDVKEAHEDARLIYVAATRAKSRLHLIGQVDGNGKSLKPKSRSLLERLWPVVSSEFEKAAQSHDDSLSLDINSLPLRGHDKNSSLSLGDNKNNSLSLSGDNKNDPLPLRGRVGVGVVQELNPEIDQPAIRRLVSGWQPPAPPEGLAWKPRAEIPYEAKSPHDEVEFSWASETAKHAGTIVHRWLQAIGEEQKQNWDRSRIEALRPSFKAELLSVGVPQEEINAAVDRVAAALVQTLEDKRGRWLLGSKREAHCEWRLTGLLDGELVDVAIDRTFVDESGVRWIVDYKTGTHEGGDLEEFLNREQERYRKQLEQYAALMRMLDSREIRLGLYFPLLKGWREWKPIGID